MCDDIYSSSFACNEEDAILLSVGAGILVVEEPDGKKRRLKDKDEAEHEESRDEENRELDEAEPEGEAFEYLYDDSEYEEEEAVEAKEIRMTTLSFAEEVCLDISTAEHLQQEINRNKNVYFMKVTGNILEDLSFVAIGFAIIAGVAFLVVARKYYARHRAKWSKDRREALYTKHRSSRKEAHHHDTSFDEISNASSRATGGSRSII